MSQKSMSKKDLAEKVVRDIRRRMRRRHSTEEKILRYEAGSIVPNVLMTDKNTALFHNVSGAR